MFETLKGSMKLPQSRATPRLWYLTALPPTRNIWEIHIVRSGLLVPEPYVEIGKSSVVQSMLLKPTTVSFPLNSLGNVP